jgi:hypothetical protein
MTLLVDQKRVSNIVYEVAAASEHLLAESKIASRTAPGDHDHEDLLALTDLKHPGVRTTHDSGLGPLPFKPLWLVLSLCLVPNIRGIRGNEQKRQTMQHPVLASDH